jgi:acyl transferase domain-containing protein
MLMQKRSGQCEVPKSRFNADGFYHPDDGISGTMNTAGGYFLQEDVRQFENNFFGINNLEATYMDPQQRKLLEVVYECLESAGLTLDDVAGTNTGVYVGNFAVDFQTMQVRDPEHLHRYSATGSGSAILANRISHVFDLQGPSFTLDTACSASIYCLHNAVNAILNEECDAAIVAGANLITSPEQHLGTMKGGVLSPDSTCHTFDASANGYGRGEAVSAIYLTRVSTALGNNDPIRAVIRATAVNANGRTPGIT